MSIGDIILDDSSSENIIRDLLEDENFVEKQTSFTGAEGREGIILEYKLKFDQVIGFDDLFNVFGTDDISKILDGEFNDELETSIKELFFDNLSFHVDELEIEFEYEETDGGILIEAYSNVTDDY